MQIYSEMITLQDVPDEIAYTISVYGCKLGCKNCSWSNVDIKPYEFTINMLDNKLKEIGNYISCVCFLGGEWYRHELIDMLDIVKKYNLKTCLYTGLELFDVDVYIRDKLDYIKVGRYIDELGGLKSYSTNQTFWDLKNNEIINRKFH